MTVEEWLALDTTESKSKKGYAHFDVRTSMRMKKEYILDPENIAHHGFYPFIHYSKKQIKYSKKRGKKSKSVISVMPHILTDASTSTIVFFWGSDTIVG